MYILCLENNHFWEISCICQWFWRISTVTGSIPCFLRLTTTQYFLVIWGSISTAKSLVKRLQNKFDVGSWTEENINAYRFLNVGEYKYIPLQNSDPLILGIVTLRKTVTSAWFQRIHYIQLSLSIDGECELKNIVYGPSTFCYLWSFNEVIHFVFLNLFTSSFLLHLTFEFLQDIGLRGHENFYFAMDRKMVKEYPSAFFTFSWTGNSTCAALPEMTCESLIDFYMLSNKIHHSNYFICIYIHLPLETVLDN